jgi:hypothetical protein
VLRYTVRFASSGMRPAGGLTGMADEGRGRELPQRAHSEARATTSPSGAPAAPVFSAELRQRLEAAVTAERSMAAAREQDRPADVKQDRPAGVKQDPPRAANAGPVTEDEVTEWLGTAGKSPEAGPPTGTARPAPGAGAEVEPESVSWLGAGLAALIVIPALVIGSLAVVAIRHFTGAPKSGPVSTALARHEAAVRGEAAAWVAQQVSRGVAVSCDQAMCAALETRGFPQHALLVLGPVSPDPRHSDVVIETAAVRALFGTSLDQAWAPAVLASFGSGAAGITVRVVAAHGTVAYQTALAGELAAGKAAGASLLADRRIIVPAPARAQLNTGLVDLRLLSALTALSRHLPVSIVQFGNVGTGASPGLPLRFADLSATGQVAASERSYLDGLKGTLRPVRTVPVVLPDGQAVLRVEFTAPSPLQA